MTVLVRLDFSDDERRALRHRTGRPGLATRAELRNETEMTMRAVLMDFVTDMQEAEGGAK